MENKMENVKEQRKKIDRKNFTKINVTDEYGKNIMNRGKVRK